MKSGFYQKIGIIIKKLINDLILKEQGDKIDSVTSYAETYDVARGTVQNAFKYLKDNGGIETRSRGYQGTFIQEINKERLLELNGQKSFIGVMPLPYSKRYQGLAQGIFLETNKQDLDIQMAFMHGDEIRINMLRERNYDFVIISHLAANYYLERYDDLEIIDNLGKHSFVKEHVIVFHEREKKKFEHGMRVGLDPSFKDLELITNHHKKNKYVEIIDEPYMKLINKTLSGEIDAAVVYVDTILERDIDINYQPIDNKTFEYLDTEAVIIAKRSDQVIKYIFSRYLNNDSIRSVQDKTLADDLKDV